MKRLLLLLGMFLAMPTSALAIEYQTLKWQDLLPTSGQPTDQSTEPKRPQQTVNHTG